MFSPASFADVLAVPLPIHLTPVACYLIEHGYTDEAIVRVIGHLARFATSQCSPDIDSEDRDAIEALLPMDPAWLSAEWDADTWTTTDREGGAL